jgi:hypothetical protein
MPYSLAQAAQACGVNRSTILRAIKSGRISGTKNEFGEWTLEPAEVHRVYLPVVRPGDVPGDATTKLDILSDLEAEIVALKTLLAEVRQDRDRWHDVAASALRALPAPAPSAPRSWWRRLAG